MRSETALHPRWIVLGGVALASAATLRHRLLRWGATREELGATLIGDEILPRADLTSTRAVTVRAATAAVWPWVAQLGQGRGGFYSYDAVENLVGCDIHSADRVVPEWQHVEVGDEFRLHPEVRLVVAHVRPGVALVVRGGVPMGSAPAPYDFTWAFVLCPGPEGLTRLVVRERYLYTTWWARLLVEPVQLVSFVMTHRMVHGIRGRVERASGPSPCPVGTFARSREASTTTD